MYIILNKRPIDVFRITAVSNPMEIQVPRYRTCLNNLENNRYDSWERYVKDDEKPVIPVMRRIFKEISKKVKITETISGTEYFKDPIDIPEDSYGWYFSINYNNREIFIVSKAYSTEEECYDAQKRLLELINTIRYTVSEVEI